MQLRKYNKATAVLVAGAVTTLVAAFIELDITEQGALTTVLTGLLVWLVPNAD